MAEGRIFTGIFTCFRVRSVFAARSLRRLPLLSYREWADRFTLTTMSETMNRNRQVGPI